MKKRLADRYKNKCVLIVCADCGKVKRHREWVTLSEDEWKKLKDRDINIILDSCGCLAIKSLNDWKGGKK
jgi:hypothetical protein